MRKLIEELEDCANFYANDPQCKDNDLALGIAQGVNLALNIVKEHSEWVSIDERLPSDGDIVEVYRYSYKWCDLVWQCLYTKAHGFRNYPVNGIGKNEKITHWREIQPPSEVQDGR